MTKKIVIAQVEEIKTGYGAGGKPWILYRITDSAGQKYSCFDDLRGSVGQDIQVNVEEKEWTGKDGVKRTSYSIGAPKKKQGDILSGLIEKKLAEMDAKLDKILDLIEEVPMDENPNKDLPF